MSLDDVLVYVDVMRQQLDFERENFAWLIASVANVAGAKPKVTIEKLLRRKSDASRPTDLRQNDIAAGFLEAMVKAPGKGVSMPLLPAASGRASEEPAAQDARQRGDIVATARQGDAPVPPDTAKANLEAFRARMQSAQKLAGERKLRGE